MCPLFTSELRNGSSARVARRHWIVPGATPWMAASQSFHCEPQSLEQPVRLDGLDTIMRTRRLKSASTGWTAEPAKHRRDGDLIGTNDEPKEPKHQGARIEARVARRNHSSSSCAWLVRPARAERMTTSQSPERTWC